MKNDVIITQLDVILTSCYVIITQFDSNATIDVFLCEFDSKMMLKWC